MRVQHNIMAMSAYRNYTNNVNAMKKNLEKLSSGYKINRAGDDAAGLAISEKMRAQITGLQQAQANAKSGINLVQTAEGALTEVHDMLNRMVKLADQSANGTYDNAIDRNQMQKEVDQLLSEINRIADSSNFNGINLLDGSLGLNQEAVSAINYLSAEGLKTGATLATAAVVASANVHGQNGTKFQAPSFTIDLSDVKIKAATSTDTGAHVVITAGGFTMSLTATEATFAATGGSIAAAAIANALTTKYGSAAATIGSALKTGTGSNTAYYKVSNSGSKITISLWGVASTGGGIDAVTSTANTEKFTEGMANAFNNAINPGSTVTVTASNGGAVDNNTHYIHGVVSYTGAQAEGNVDRWGADVDLTNTLMQNGNELTIDGTTFKIALSSTATTGVNNGTVTINTKDYATAGAQLKKFAELMEGQSAGRFTVSAKAGNKLHIDVRASVAASSVASLSTDAMTKIVKAKKADIAAHNAGVEFILDDSKLVKGDVIKVGNGTAAKSFVYQGSGTNGFTSATDLKAKLTAIYSTPGQVATAAGSNGKVKFTIYASSATAAAPMVQGRGLTLQIGDTSDKFNQLNVGVQDMHAVSLGIDGLSIKNEVDAQGAIQKIKNAINTVSDVRGTLGATQNRLDHTINNLSVMQENIQDAESTIRDTDVAEEMMAYTKNNILIQSAQAMLAQANQVPQGVLQLLQ